MMELKKEDVKKYQTITAGQMREGKLEALSLACRYNGTVPKHVLALPFFIAQFSEYIEHPSNGAYYNDAYIRLDTVEDCLSMDIEYEYRSSVYEEYKKYCYRFLVDFSKESPMHYAYSSQNSDGSKAKGLPEIDRKGMRDVLNCITVDRARYLGYRASYNIGSDESDITCNGEHTTITKYLAAAFGMQDKIRMIDSSSYPLIDEGTRRMAASARYC